MFLEHIRYNIIIGGNLSLASSGSLQSRNNTTSGFLCEFSSHNVFAMAVLAQTLLNVT